MTCFVLIILIVIYLVCKCIFASDGMLFVGNKLIDYVRAGPGQWCAGGCRWLGHAPHTVACRRAVHHRFKNTHVYVRRPRTGVRGRAAACVSRPPPHSHRRAGVWELTTCPARDRPTDQLLCVSSSRKCFTVCNLFNGSKSSVRKGL